MKRLFLPLLITLALALSLPPAPAVAQMSKAFDLSQAWAVVHAPVAATQATITKAARAGWRHVATSVTVCTVGVAAQGPITFNLRDGTTGAGTILWTVTLAAPIGTSACQESPDLMAAGTSGNALTLESSTAPAATNFATVSLTGYDVLR